MSYNFKLVSKDGDFLPLALRLSEAGHPVAVYIESEKAKRMYDGLLYKVEGALELDISTGDIVLFDMVGAGREADTLKDKGYTVVGGGGLNDALELNRDWGDSFMNEHGIETPDSVGFHEYDVARQWLEDNPGRYVFKPDGNLDTALTYVSEDHEDMVGMLPFLCEKCEGGMFSLQEYVDGIEMSTEGWFNGERFILPLNSTMEEKRLFSGGVGPNTGCMGNVVWLWPEDVSQFLHGLLFKGLEQSLKESNYLGPLDINAIWTPEGPRGLEFTARFGYDAIQAMHQLVGVEGIVELLANLEGLNTFPEPLDGKVFGISVRVSIPPYPHEGDVPKVPIAGVTLENKEHVYLSDVALGRDIDELVCAGADGYVATIASAGRSISSTLREIYEIVEDLRIPNKQYRNDIGDRVPLEKRQVERMISASIRRTES